MNRRVFFGILCGAAAVGRVRPEQWTFSIIGRPAGPSVASLVCQVRLNIEEFERQIAKMEKTWGRISDKLGRVTAFGGFNPTTPRDLGRKRDANSGAGTKAQALNTSAAP